MMVLSQQLKLCRLLWLSLIAFLILTCRRRVVIAWRGHIDLTTKLHVVLLLDEDIDFDTKLLTQWLKDTFPDRCIHLLSSSSQDEQDYLPLRVKYGIYYDVSHAKKALLERYIDALVQGSKLIDVITNENGNSEEVVIESSIGIIAPQLEAIAKDAISASSSSSSSTSLDDLFGVSEVTLLVASPDSRELLRRLKRYHMDHGDADAGVGERLDNWKDHLMAANRLSYRFSEPEGTHSPVERDTGAGISGGASRTARSNSSTCAKTWLGMGRALFLDVGAQSCKFGAISSHSIPEGTVMEGSLPSAWGGDVDVVERGRLFPAALYEGKTQQQHHYDGGKPSSKAIKAAFNVKLMTAIVSAFRTVLSPDLPADIELLPRELLLVPIVVMRAAEGEGGDTQREVDHIIDVPAVRAALQAVAMPGQQVVVVGATHSLGDHPQVAVALMKAVTARSQDKAVNSGSSSGGGDGGGGGGDGGDRRHVISQDAYIDSVELLYAMKMAGDALVSELLADAGAGEWDDSLKLDLALEAGRSPEELSGAGGIKRGAQLRRKVKVLPVFVFSLDGLYRGYHHITPGDVSGQAPERQPGSNDGKRKNKPSRFIDYDTEYDCPFARLFEDETPVAAPIGGGAVLVLQSGGAGVEVPYFEDGRKLKISLADASHNVVAGLLTALYGVHAPHKWWSPPHGRWMYDMTWAHGFHPFAPFGWVGGNTDSHHHAAAGKEDDGRQNSDVLKINQELVPSKLLVDICHRNVVLAGLTASALHIHAAVDELDAFVNRVLPGDVILPDALSVLTDMGGASAAGWSKALKKIANKIGLVVPLTPIIDFQKNDLRTFVAFWQTDVRRLQQGRKLMQVLITIDALHLKSQQLSEKAAKLVKDAELAVSCCSAHLAQEDDVITSVFGQMAGFGGRGSSGGGHGDGDSETVSKSGSVLSSLRQRPALLFGGIMVMFVMFVIAAALAIYLAMMKYSHPATRARRMSTQSLGRAAW